MKVIIVHNAVGKIVSTGQIEAGAQENIGAGIMPEPGESVLELDASEDEAKSLLTDARHEYIVDINKRKLTKRSG
jgi:hypothetical protein